MEQNSVMMTQAQVEYLLNCRRKLARDNKLMVAIVLVACAMAMTMTIAYAVTALEVLF